jgi:hypothetical protein
MGMAGVGVRGRDGGAHETRGRSHRVGDILRRQINYRRGVVLFMPLYHAVLYAMSCT